jgi:2-oxoisovalerate dehydrogenase E1 component
VACGLASYGRKPVFEIQFVDFTWPGFNQLISNIATLRWRSFGDWSCPCVIYAPYGGYLPGGGLWHSQANEAIFAHVPGLKVVVPSTPQDAAGLFWTAMHGSDPVIILIPKHMLWRERSLPGPAKAVPLGRANLVREGSDVTLVAWGNCVEIAEEAIDELGGMVSVELIDLRSIVPWDREMVFQSIRRTGRLVVVQEDGETCSLGQAIIASATGDGETFEALQSPPVLVSKVDVHIGFSSVYEYGALPDKARVEAGIRKVMGGHVRRPAPAASTTEGGISAAKIMTHAYSTGDGAGEEVVKVARQIVVPMLGEGITNARLVSLLKRPGDRVAADESILRTGDRQGALPGRERVRGRAQGVGRQ